MTTFTASLKFTVAVTTSPSFSGCVPVRPVALVSSTVLMKGALVSTVTVWLPLPAMSAPPPSVSCTFSA